MSALTQNTILERQSTSGFAAAFGSRKVLQIVVAVGGYLFPQISLSLSLKSTLIL